MDSAENLEIYFFILGISGMFILAVSIIAFFLAYQKRLHRQQKVIHEERIRHKDSIVKAIVEAQEKEKERIGRDLHDEIGAMLSSAILTLSHSNQQNHPLSPTFNQIESVQELLNETANSVRRISHDLVPNLLIRLGLAEALDALFEKFESSSNLFFYLEIDKEIDEEMRLDYRLHLYRIITELLNNTLKHANATEVKLTVKGSSSEWSLHYQDNGKGMAFTEISNKNGLGLKNLEGRLSMMNGNMKISNLEPKGVLFQLVIPKTHEREFENWNGG